MATPPNYFLLRPKSATIFHSQKRPARALGRVHQAYGGAGIYYIMPSAEANPYATDQNGQSYPAGTIAVRQYWYPGHDDSTEQGFGVTFAGVMLVPDTLPSGYTANWKREFYFRPGSTDVSRGQGWASGGRVFAPNPGGLSLSNRRRIGSVLHDYWYMPEAQGDGSYDSGYTNFGTIWSGYASAGLRYIRWSQVPAGITCDLRSYADGHRGNTTAATVVHQTFTGPGDSGFLPGVSFAVGEKRHMQYYISGGTTQPMEVQSAARCDLALPWTVTGPTLLAPGGYVASALDVALPT